MFTGYSFDYAFRMLLVILPFMTVLSVFTRERLGIPGFAFLKEILLVSILLTVVYAHVTKLKKIEWSYYDSIIGLYIVVMVSITFFTTGTKGLVYGGRYDFAFLGAFLALYHGRYFLREKTSYYIRLFLFSGGAMILLSFLLKWPLSEDLLLYLGYSGNPSNWQFGSSVPIFHGVDGANVRRLQGLLDGPNTMAAFLIFYMGVFVYFFRLHKEWYFLVGGIATFLVGGIIYTYSRSAYLGLIGGVGIIILFLIPQIYKNYKKEFLTLLALGIAGVGVIGLQYAGNMKAIIQRGGSTNGHIERMKIGLERFGEKPLGQGLGSAGPAYRHVNNLAGKDRKDIEELDRYYIPESWYIQQMVEGGIVGSLLFILIILSLWWGLYRKHIILAGMFFSILIMNFFLHTFESAVVSLSLFLIVGLILSPYSSSHASR